MESFLPIIGLEVHIELETKSKMFCSCIASHFGKKPNTQVCPVCLGLPGALPAPNKKAIEWTVLLGMALNCQILPASKFDRKNYFYPDLPKGYQISQYDAPLGEDGMWVVGSGKKVRIRRVHLEEDTGKLIHEAGSTLIDFNRSGVPLLEIVTEPNISSALEAKEFLEKLQQVVRYLGISQADMEKGQMRCEPTVNLKIKKEGKTFYTPLVEIKNINSFRFVQKAIEFEIKRQLEEFQKTGIEKQLGNKTTRGWDETLGKTIPQRIKEEAADYRYFPEPDVPPIKWRNEEIEKLRKLLPELPEEKIERFGKQYGLARNVCLILTETKDKADYFEEACRAARGISNQQIANWIVNKRVNISRTKPKDLVNQILAKAKRPTVKEEELGEIIKKVLEKNQKAVVDYKKGKVQSLEFLVGKVMEESRGKADPDSCRKNLLDALRVS